MALQIIDHYPHFNECNIARNSRIKVLFNSGIIPQSVVYTHFSINDASSFVTVPGQLGVEYISGIPMIAVFTPDINMLSNNKYRVYIYGSPNSITSQNNEQLETTYSFEFTTGTGILPQSSFIPGIPSGIYEDYISDSTSASDSGIITELTIAEVYPQNQQPNVATNLKQIDITFNIPIASTIEELNNLITLDIKDVLY